MSRFDADNYIPYENMEEKLEVVKKRLNRPLTMSEKIVYSHLDDPYKQVRIMVYLFPTIASYLTLSLEISF